MNATTWRRLVRPFAVLLALTAMTLVLRQFAAPRAQAHAASRAREAWARRVEEQRRRVAERPDDPGERLKLANRLLELGLAKSVVDDSAGSPEGEESGPQVERERQQTTYAATEETLEAGRLLRDLTEPPHPAAVRARAWELLAAVSARIGDPEGQAACLDIAAALRHRRDPARED